MARNKEECMFAQTNNSRHGCSLLLASCSSANSSQKRTRTQLLRSNTRILQHTILWRNVQYQELAFAEQKSKEERMENVAACCKSLPNSYKCYGK